MLYSSIFTTDIVHLRMWVDEQELGDADSSMVQAPIIRLSGLGQIQTTSFQWHRDAAKTPVFDDSKLLEP